MNGWMDGWCVCVCLMCVVLLALYTQWVQATLLLVFTNYINTGSQLWLYQVATLGCVSLVYIVTPGGVFEVNLSTIMI